MNLTLAAIRRPVWVLMVMLAMLVLGFLGLRSMPREQNPEVDFPFVTVTTVYPGAGPEEIETLVTKPIEDAVTSIEGLKQITSTSQEGVSVVAIEFELGTDTDVALQEVTSKVESISGQLPRDAERPVASKLNVAAQPILTIAVESDQLNALQLRDLVDDRVRPRLARIEGVADISVSGGQVREIRVAVRKDRLLSYGLGIREALNAIAGATLDLPAGRIEREGTEVGVRVSGEFKSVEELRNLVIPISDRQNPNRPPAIVRLKDIATVIDGPAERTEISRINGRDAVVLRVQKTRDGNTVKITEQVEQALTELEGLYPVRFTTTVRSADRVNESLEDLYIALVLGIALVVLIIYIFLHNFRGTLIVALAIPTSLFAAFAAIAAMGYSLNTMTMLGLSLAIGILVDDAIVVLENTYRHLTMGEAPREAALNGRLEIGLAAVSITLVDVVVFVPIALMGGIVGQFMRPFALTVVAATLFSLFVSFTLTPMLASRWYRENEYEEPTRGFAGWFDRSLHRFADAYSRRVDWALRHRWWVIWIGVAALVGVIVSIAGGSQPSYAGAARIGFFFLPIALVFAVVGSLFGAGKWRRLRSNAIGAVLFAGAMSFAGVTGHFFTQMKGAPLFLFTFFPTS
ncbi:MAG: efflux RND transporter permease subunit, partial [Armatimonadetes bacterium]